MDYDDVDYFPRRGKRAERADSAKGEYTQQRNLQALDMSGLKFHEVNKGDVCVFRSSGKPTVDFFTRKNRWQVRGLKKTTHGTVQEFLQFISAFHGVPVTIDGIEAQWTTGDQNTGMLLGKTRVPGDHLGGPALSWTEDASHDLRSKPAQLSALGQIMAYDEFDHLTPEQQTAFDPPGQDLISLLEARRPGLLRIVERLQRENPRMSFWQALADAKVLWTSEFIMTEVDGVMTRRSNPDYRGGAA